MDDKDVREREQNKFIKAFLVLNYLYIRNEYTHPNTMKLICRIFILLFVLCSLSANAKNSQDSLLYIIKTTKDLQQKYVTYMNLADMNFEMPVQQTYLKAAYKLAQQSGDKKATLNVLMELFNCYLRTAQGDSIDYCMNAIEDEFAPDKANSYLAYLRMRIFDKEIMEGKEASEAVMKKELDIFKNSDKNDIYIRIEQAYITGSSLYENNKYKEAVVYLETAYNLAKTLRNEERCRYLIITGWAYATALELLHNPEKCLELMEEVLQQHKENYNRNFVGKRPFFPMHLYYLQCYASLLKFIDILPQNRTQYYMNEIKLITPKVTAMFDKYSCCQAMLYYYTYTRDFKSAISYNDSLIKYAKVLGPTILPELFRAKSGYYAALKDYKNALESHELYSITKDSLSCQQAAEQLNNLQIQYNLDKLTYDKTLLESRNRRTILIILGFVLLFVCAACIYLYHSLKKERHMKIKLRDLNEKAGESEKLKTVFLNSMCHEIRTPLNSIVGFSGIIIDESIDCDSKREFYDLIADNTKKLTTIVDHLLTVANLDSSDEKFPCELTDIRDLCQLELDKAEQEGKSGIVYALDFPDEEVKAMTNRAYLALIIQNLLNNANKFTQQGEIRLSVSTNQNQVEIDVTDTGCGIPVDKQKEVFLRFAQLDTFTQGNGLGLYICNVIINRLSGSIKIDPDYTNGSRFVISLPKE